MTSAPCFCTPFLPPRPTSRALRRTPAPRLRPCRRRRAVATFSPSPHPHPPHPNRSPDYYANVGTVIDTLRADVPHILHRAPDMAIYSQHLTFCDGSGYRVTGKDAYKTVLWLLRAQARLFLTAAYVEVQSMYHDDQEGCVYLRWRMSANPRWSTATRCVLDGMSVYRLDLRGWVYHHTLENSARRRDRRPVFDGLTVDQVRKGRVVGAGVGAGGLPGWYRTLLEPVEFVPVEEIDGDGKHSTGLSK